MLLEKLQEKKRENRTKLSGALADKMTRKVPWGKRLWG